MHVSFDYGRRLCDTFKPAREVGKEFGLQGDIDVHVCDVTVEAAVGGEARIRVDGSEQVELEKRRRAGPAEGESDGEEREEESDAIASNASECSSLLSDVESGAEDAAEEQ